MLQKIKTYIYKYSLIIIGFLLLAIYFWNRFLRQRTPKEFTLELSLLQFFILIYTCLIFVYIIISLIKPRKTNNLVEQFIDLLFTPISEFDKWFKNLPIIKPYYERFKSYLFPKLDFLIIQTELFFCIFWLLPRLILLIAFFIDVYFLHKFYLKYMVILFGLFLFLNRVFKYSLKNIKNDLIIEGNTMIQWITTSYYPGIHPVELNPDEDEDDEDDDDLPPPSMALPFDIFLKFQVESIVYQNITRDVFSIHGFWHFTLKLWLQFMGHEYFDRHHIPKNYKNKFGEHAPENYNQAYNFIIHEKRKILEEKLQEILTVCLITEFYNKTNNTNNLIKYIKILIYLNYLLCWSYVLIKGLPCLDIDELFKVINKTWQNIDIPF